MKFLAGVGVAQLFEGDKLVATANALIDSSISISVSTEDLRAGMGAKLLGRYMHSSGMTLKLTDAMFNLEYLAMNTGSDVEIGGDAMINEQVTAAGGKITLSNAPRPFFGDKINVYVKPAGSNLPYTAYSVAKDAPNPKEIAIAGENGDYCVRYMANNAAATKIMINSNFIPKTLSVILTANLYNGGSCDVSMDNASLAGSLQIKIFRFQLNGNQELSMTATGVSNTSIEGTALSWGCNGCDGEGVYAEILEFTKNVNDNIASIIVEDADKTVAANSTVQLVVYACPEDGAPIKLQAGQFEIVEGKANTYTVNKTNKDSIDIAASATGNFTVEVKAFDKTASAHITIG